MSALRSGPAVPGWLAGALIGVALGAAGGYHAAAWNAKPPAAASSGGPGGPGGGMGGMMGGGGGASEHPQAAALIRTVGALATLEKARGKELSADQRAKIAAIAKSLDSDAALTEEQCEAKLNELNAVLRPDQQSTLEELTPRRGGRGGPGGGGGGGMMRPAGAPGGMNGPAGAPPAGMNGPSGGGRPGGMGGMMGGMGGGGMDYERPFKEGRGRERLEELLESLNAG